MQQKLYDFSRSLYDRKRGYLVIIYGRNGCAKTHSARGVKAWFNAHRLDIGPVAVKTDEGDEVSIPDCCFRNWPAVVDGFKQDQWSIVDRLSSDYLTIIDDVGAEHDPSKIGLEKLYLILSRREFKHTIITTNIPDKNWETKFERRIASRLLRNSVHVDLTQVPDFNS